MTDYWARVRQRAAELGSDGCSGVLDVYLDACLEHDIHYRTHRRLDGSPITRKEADALFRQRMQERSLFGAFSPMAWWRWLGVRAFGASAWSGATGEPRPCEMITPM